MAGPGRDRSLQDVLRARREQAGLLPLREVRAREAARLREEKEAAERAAAEQEAVGIVAGWRASSEAFDGRSRISPAVYAAVFALEPAAYFASAHWRRVSRAQRAAAAECEVARCDRPAKAVRHAGTPAIGAEQTGRDVVSLCDGCDRRARRAARTLARPLTRAEIADLDPLGRLYDRDAIAELRARYDLG
jgi:hypothetical protein